MEWVQDEKEIMTSCGSIKEKTHKNPASPDTPSPFGEAWSNTIPVFLRKNRNLLLFVIYGFIFISLLFGFNLQEPWVSIDFGDGSMYALCYTEAGMLVKNIVSTGR